jgi:hypothetical protein
MLPDNQHYELPDGSGFVTVQCTPETLANLCTDPNQVLQSKFSLTGAGSDELNALQMPKITVDKPISRREALMLYDGHREELKKYREEGVEDASGSYGAYTVLGALPSFRRAHEAVIELRNEPSLSQNMHQFLKRSWNNLAVNAAENRDALLTRPIADRLYAMEKTAVTWGTATAVPLLASAVAGVNANLATQIALVPGVIGTVLFHKEMVGLVAAAVYRLIFSSSVVRQVREVQDGVKIACFLAKKWGQDSPNESQSQTET